MTAKIYMWMSEKNGMAQHEEKKRVIRDIPEEVIFGLFLILVISMYLLRDQLPHGARMWRAWIMVGTGILFVLDSVIREITMQHRWSSYARFVVGVVLVEVGAGLIYGFEKFGSIYVCTIVYISLYTVINRHRMR